MMIPVVTLLLSLFDLFLFKPTRLHGAFQSRQEKDKKSSPTLSLRMYQHDSKLEVTTIRLHPKSDELDNTSG